MEVKVKEIVSINSQKEETEEFVDLKRIDKGFS